MVVVQFSTECGTVECFVFVSGFVVSCYVYVAMGVKYDYKVLVVKSSLVKLLHVIPQL